MRKVRLILILIVGGILTYLTYKTKYQTFFFDSIIWGGLILIGLLIFVWTIIKDIQLFMNEKRVRNFKLTFSSLLFIATILTLEVYINMNFNKSTLLKVFYDGDFNGTSIDFKTDGTYILDNSAIGLSDYFYGTYKIYGNKITMDIDTIDNLINLKYLEIMSKQTGEGKTEQYLFQVDSLGNLIKRSYEYRVIIDNRIK